jgi:hypothetical protein
MTLENYSRGKAPKERYAGISRQKGNLLSKREENRRRNKLGVDRHGDWKEQYSHHGLVSLLLVLFWGTEV